MFVKKKPKTCPKCSNTLDPSWGHCPYCDGVKNSNASSTAGRRPTIPTPEGTSDTSQKPATNDRHTIVGGSDEKNPDSRTNTRKIVGVLVSYTWVPGGQIYPIREGKNCITREKNTQYDGYNILVPEDGSISTPHALILCRSGNYEIMDLVSGNGTLIRANDDFKPEDMIPSNVSVKLEHKAKIKTGRTTWTFIKIDA